MVGLLSLNFGHAADSISVKDNYISDYYYIINLKANIDESFSNLDNKIKEVISKGLKKNYKLLFYKNGSNNKTDNEKKYIIKKEIQTLKKLNAANILDEIIYVGFENISLDDCLSYIKSNNELKNKRIVLPGVYNLLDDFSEIFEKFDGYDNIYVSIKKNKNINLKDLKKVLKTIDDVINTINGYNFSPFEKLIYIYDIVRDETTLLDKEYEDTIKKNSIYDACFGIHGTKNGYVNLFNILCSKAGIKSINYNLYDSHTRNIVYLKDEKYNINGFYFIDATYDAKKDDNSFLQSYLYFGKTYYFFDKIDKNKNYEYTSINPDNLLNIFDLFANNLDLTYNVLNIESFLSSVRTIQKITESSNFSILDLVNKNDVKLQKVRSNIESNIPLFYNEIPDSSFMKALYTVRMKQFYQNPEKYKLSPDELQIISKNSGFNYVDSNDEINNSNIIDMSNEEIEKDISRIKFTRIMRMILEKEKNM